MWIGQIMIPEYENTTIFGYGDTYGLDGGLQKSILAEYRKSHGLISSQGGWANIGSARNSMLHNDIGEAIYLYRWVLGRGQYSRHAVSAIKDEMKWMDQNGIEGTGQIVDALGLGSKLSIWGNRIKSLIEGATNYHKLIEGYI